MRRLQIKIWLNIATFFISCGNFCNKIAKKCNDRAIYYFSFLSELK